MNTELIAYFESKTLPILAMEVCMVGINLEKVA